MIPCDNFIAIWRGITVTEANVDVMRRGLLLCEFRTHDVRCFSKGAAKAAKKENFSSFSRLQ